METKGKICLLNINRKKTAAPIETGIEKLYETGRFPPPMSSLLRLYR